MLFRLLFRLFRLLLFRLLCLLFAFIYIYMFVFLCCLFSVCFHCCSFCFLKFVFASVCLFILFCYYAYLVLALKLDTPGAIEPSFIYHYVLSP